MVRLGPLVPRSAHRAGALLLAASVEFTAAMAIGQLGYPGYSDVGNAISDLGNTATSPWWVLFSAGIVLLGVLGAVGGYLLRHALRPRTTSRLGLALLIAAFVAAAGAGLNPENLRGSLHALLALATFAASGIALLILSAAMLRDTRWDGWRLYTAISGAVVLGALVALSVRVGGSADFGLVERVVVAPSLLWAALTGLRLLRIPVYDPSKPSYPVPTPE